MSCVVDVARPLKAEILHYSPKVRNEIGSDLLALQEDPLPADRADLTRPYGYFHQLPCGYYVSWELIGDQQDLLLLILTGTCRNITVRILGAGEDPPAPTL
ncbi:MAG TPA: hypothetical protein VK814_17530 [Acidobacteriaceae bacterium]|jgi:hypothetical protein|nr:hypothetical protein [Acidobacteriaceae bacterium]